MAEPTAGTDPVDAPSEASAGEATVAPPPPLPPVEPDMAPEPPDEPEPVPFDVSAMLDLRPDGSIVVKMEPEVALPRPKFRAMKDIIRENGQVNDSLRRVQDRALAFLNRQAAAAAEIEGPAVTDETLAKRDEVRTESRELSDKADEEIMAALGAWWTLVFERLVEDEAKRPSDDDWPSWFLDGRLPNIMLTHWRFVPRGPG